MVPELHSGDLAVAAPRDEYVVGDTILFKQYGGIVVHQIAGGTAANGWQVKGIAANTADPWLVTPDRILGKVVWSNAALGAVGRDAVDGGERVRRCEARCVAACRHRTRVCGR